MASRYIAGWLGALECVLNPKAKSVSGRFSVYQMTNHTGLEEGPGPLCSSGGRAANPRTISAAPLTQEKGLSGYVGERKEFAIR